MAQPPKPIETLLPEFGPVRISDFAKAEDAKLCWTQLLRETDPEAETPDPSPESPKPCSDEK
jgi:hypothetical protein